MPSEGLIPATHQGLDLLRWPVIGRWLRWRHARTSLQLCFLVAAAIVIVHGLLGPQVGAANLATVLTWVHYRGLLVVALLAAGNLFCTGCPFVLTRDWGRRLHAPTWRWPRRLRGKWMAVVLFGAVLFTYELFDLWALPQGTAYLVLTYFAAAMTVDLLFTGASFCKHLCPIGHFNFIASVMSPLEVRIREKGTCQTCTTSDCIVGRRAAEAPQKILQRGCELGLYLPAKVGNIDCTFCLDCVHACPHDNVTIASRPPGLELADTRRRSGIGRLTNRADIGGLTLLFVFAALLNAFAMTPPVYALEGWLARIMGTTSEAVVLGLLFLVLLGILPLLLVTAAAACTRMLGGNGDAPLSHVALRFTYALVPFGLSMWVAHYAFHLLTGGLVIVPVLQSAVADLMGWGALGAPLWRWTGMRPGSVFPIQLGAILLGTAGSLALVSLISGTDYPQRPGRAALPWAMLVLVLAAAAVWVLVQPMEMRGMGLNG